MLANPIPVLLELKDTLGLSAEQVAAVEEVSAALQEKLNERREALGKRLDGVSGPEQMRAFVGLQPEIEAARREVTEVLGAVQKILTPEQWERVPERVREPFRRWGRPGAGPALGRAPAAAQGGRPGGGADAAEIPPGVYLGAGGGEPR